MALSKVLYAQLNQDKGSIPVSSPLIQEWPSKVWVKRGYINISDTSETDKGTNRASFGHDSTLLKPLTVMSSSVVSLGDGGEAILYFSNAITNEEGIDFAVYENSFDGKFLELAFVEVSEDGEKYVRFPNQSYTQTKTQIASFGLLEKDSLYNLAGKYPKNEGTPFDLDDIEAISGINTSNIHYVKIIDVVGSIDPKYATYDTENNLINDPFPTSFSSGGFDLAGVAALHVAKTNAIFSSVEENENIRVFPIPTTNGKISVFIENSSEKHLVTILTLSGEKVQLFESYENQIDFFNPNLKGIYILKVENKKETVVKKVIFN